MNHIVQYFYIESENNVSQYGVVEKNYKKRNEYYFRCIINFFYSSLFFNKNSMHYFITNDISNLNFIDNFDFYKFCNQNNIKIIEQKSRYVVPRDKWAGSMYLFDAVECFNNKAVNKDDYCIFFDNDVLINKPMDKMINQIGKFNYLLYNINFEIKREGAFHNIDISKLPDDFNGYGGEFFAANSEYIGEFLNEFYKVREIQHNLTTEEHYLSYIFFKYKGMKLANDYIKRIWTTIKYNNVEANDKNLYIIHAPSEKEYGLFYYNKYLLNRNKYDPHLALKYISITKRPLLIKIKCSVKKAKNILFRYCYKALSFTKI